MVGGEGRARGAEAEVEPRVLRAGGHDGERLDAELLELLRRDAELGDGAPAEGAVEPAEQRQQDRAPPAVIAERHGAVVVDRGQREVRGRRAHPDGRVRL